jgi:hypothetical protein
MCWNVGLATGGGEKRQARFLGMSCAPPLLESWVQHEGDAGVNENECAGAFGRRSFKKIVTRSSSICATITLTIVDSLC